MWLKINLGGYLRLLTKLRICMKKNKKRKYLRQKKRSNRKILQKVGLISDKKQRLKQSFNFRKKLKS